MMVVVISLAFNFHFFEIKHLGSDRLGHLSFDLNICLFLFIFLFQSGEKTNLIVVFGLIIINLGRLLVLVIYFFRFVHRRLVSTGLVICSWFWPLPLISVVLIYKAIEEQKLLEIVFIGGHRLSSDHI